MQLATLIVAPNGEQFTEGTCFIKGIIFENRLPIKMLFQHLHQRSRFLCLALIETVYTFYSLMFPVLQLSASAIR